MFAELYRQNGKVAGFVFRPKKGAKTELSRTIIAGEHVSGQAQRIVNIANELAATTDRVQDRYDECPCVGQLVNETDERCEECKADKKVLDRFKKFVEHPASILDPL